MVYFRFRNGNSAFNTFACSYDFVKWTRWKGKPLIESEYEWENIHAHKPRLLKHGGVVYHFYCAVNNKNERFIAVATSKQMICIIKYKYIQEK